MTFGSFTSSSSTKFSRSLPAPLPILALSVLAVAALFLYGYSLRTAIGYAVEREGVTENIALLRASLSSLDGEYVLLTKGLSIDHAKSLGFHEVTDPMYISLSSLPETVSLRAH